MALEPLEVVEGVAQHLGLAVEEARPRVVGAAEAHLEVAVSLQTVAVEVGEAHLPRAVVAAAALVHLEAAVAVGEPEHLVAGEEVEVQALLPTKLQQGKTLHRVAAEVQAVQAGEE